MKIHLTALALVLYVVSMGMCRLRPDNLFLLFLACSLWLVSLIESDIPFTEKMTIKSMRSKLAERCHTTALGRICEVLSAVFLILFMVS